MYLVGAVPVVVTGRRACLDDAVVAQDKASAVPKYIFIIKKERIFFCNQIHIPSSLEVIKKKAYQI